MAAPLMALVISPPAAAAVMLPVLCVMDLAGIAGIYLGVWLQRRMEPRWFYRIIYALLLVTGSKLL